MPKKVIYQKPDENPASTPIGQNYGPTGPKAKHYYENYSTPYYLTGHARKIMLDLIRVAKMYNGKQIRVYKVTGTERCPVCTNSITGEIMLSNCKVCHGTGKKDAWELLGDYWAYVELGPEQHVATELGITMSPDAGKENFVIIGAPILEDQDFFVSIETKKVYKIFNVEPRIVAMGGTVIAQIASVGDIEDGSPEHEVIDW